MFHRWGKLMTFVPPRSYEKSRAWHRARNYARYDRYRGYKRTRGGGGGVVSWKAIRYKRQARPTCLPTGYRFRYNRASAMRIRVVRDRVYIGEWEWAETSQRARELSGASEPESPESTRVESSRASGAFDVDTAIRWKSSEAYIRTYMTVLLRTSKHARNAVPIQQRWYTS